MIPETQIYLYYLDIGYRKVSVVLYILESKMSNNLVNNHFQLSLSMYRNLIKYNFLNHYSYIAYCVIYIYIYHFEYWFKKWHLIKFLCMDKVNWKWLFTKLLDILIQKYKALRWNLDSLYLGSANKFEFLVPWLWLSE